MAFSLTEELKDKEYRDAFVASRVREGIAFQLRALRESRGWDQKTLAKEMGKPTAQPMISRYESGDYGGFSASSLLELASVFDVGLKIEFAPFSQLVKDDREMSHVSKLQVPTYTEECEGGLLEESSPSAKPFAWGSSNKFLQGWFETSSFGMPIPPSASGPAREIYQTKGITYGEATTELEEREEAA